MPVAILAAFIASVVMIIVLLANTFPSRLVAVTIACVVLVVSSGIAGLRTFWRVADALDFARHGYRVRQVGSGPWSVGSKHDCVYEEFSSASGVRSLSFTREVLAEGGYPARTAIHLPNESDWDATAPAWARGRHSEISNRIRDLTAAGRIELGA
jgi:hypothetical protein